MEEGKTSSVLDSEVVQELKSLQRPGEPDIFLSLIDLFLEASEEAGQQIQSALQTGNLVALSDAAHSLKSSSANIGALQLSKVCFELEKIEDRATNEIQLKQLSAAFSQEFDLLIRELNALKAAA